MPSNMILRPQRNMKVIFWKRRKSIAPVTQNGFWHVMKHVAMSQSATPATRNRVAKRLQPLQVTALAAPARGTAIATSRGHVRTVVKGWATSCEHALNPQPPRVKRELLLGIREKGCQWYHAFNTPPWSLNSVRIIVCDGSFRRVVAMSMEIVHSGAGFHPQLLHYFTFATEQTPSKAFGYCACHAGHVSHVGQQEWHPWCLHKETPTHTHIRPSHRLLQENSAFGHSNSEKLSQGWNML